MEARTPKKLAETLAGALSFTRAPAAIVMSTPGVEFAQVPPEALSVSVAIVVIPDTRAKTGAEASPASILTFESVRAAGMMIPLVSTTALSALAGTVVDPKSK
jgi:hypothetical protein